MESKAKNANEKSKAREKRLKFYTLMVYEDADATLLRLFECFMESAPQLILQVLNYFSKQFQPEHWIFDRET